MNSTAINTISVPISNESIPVSSSSGHIPIMYYFIVVGVLMLICLALIMLFYWYHHRNLVELIRVSSQPQQRLDTKCHLETTESTNISMNAVPSAPSNLTIPSNTTYAIADGINTSKTTENKAKTPWEIFAVKTQHNI